MTDNIKRSFKKQTTEIDKTPKSKKNIFDVKTITTEDLPLTVPINNAHRN